MVISELQAIVVNVEIIVLKSRSHILLFKNLVGLFLTFNMWLWMCAVAHFLTFSRRCIQVDVSSCVSDIIHCGCHIISVELAVLEVGSPFFDLVRPVALLIANRTVHHLL